MNSKSTSPGRNPFTVDSKFTTGSKRPPPPVSSPTFTPKQIQYLQPPEAFKATPCPLLRIASSTEIDGHMSRRPSLGIASSRLSPSPGSTDTLRSEANNLVTNSLSSPRLRTSLANSDLVAVDFSQLSIKKENEKKLSFNNSNIGRLSFAGSDLSSSVNQSIRRASVAIPQAAGRASLNGTSSTVQNASSQLNFVNLVGPLPSKDPRPIREKSFQFSCIKSLIKFLSECGYDRPLSPKLLSSPSAKDFASIFKFLYAQLDPTFIWTPDKKFEEEVPLLLKSLRYPYANDISKSHLYAVGSMHAWPGLLAMLQWLVDLILCCDQLQTAPTQSSDSASFISELATGAMNGNKASIGTKFAHLSSAYRLFLSGDENYELLQTELESHFAFKTNSIERETEIINSEIQSLEREIQTLESIEPPLISLEKERTMLLGDIEKMKKFHRHLESKKQKFETSISQIQSQIITAENEKLSALENKANLEVLVANQKISPMEAERLQNEKESLSKLYSALKASRAEWIRQVTARERENTFRLDQLGNLFQPYIIDKLISEFNGRVERLHLAPLDAKHAHGKDYLLVGGSNATQNKPLLNLDLKQSVMPVVYALQDSMLVSYQSISSQLSTKSEILSSIKDTIADRQEELSRMEERVHKTEMEYKNSREQYLSENASLSAEIDHLEVELLKMRSETATGYLASQQTLQKAILDHDQLLIASAEEKEKCAKEVFSTLEQCICVKSHIESVFTNFEKWLSSLPQENQSYSSVISQ